MIKKNRNAKGSLWKQHWIQYNDSFGNVLNIMSNKLLNNTYMICTILKHFYECNLRLKNLPLPMLDKIYEKIVKSKLNYITETKIFFLHIKTTFGAET